MSGPRGARGDEIAVLGEFADERVDLPQGERRAWYALQVAAHEPIGGLAEVARCGAGFVDRLRTVPPHQRQDPEDAPTAEDAVACGDLLTEDADGRPHVPSAMDELLQASGGVRRPVLGAGAIAAWAIDAVLAQQRAGLQIE
jgi:hypothetical protein